MHLTLGHHKLAAIMAISLLGAFFPGGLVSAEPVILQDATQQQTGVIDPTESVLEPAAFAVEVGGGQGRTINGPGATQGRVTRTEQARNPSNPTTQTKVDPQNSPAAPSSVSPGPDLAAEIRSTVKESVRPLHDQLVESGALEAWNDLKTDLGLSKNKWGNEGATDVNPTMPGRLEASNSASWQDPAHRPKTAAQAEIDREMASLMMEKLIEEVKPWVFSLVVLYLLGYLIKAGFDYSQRKSIRRRERATARILRRSSRKAGGARPDA